MFHLVVINQKTGIPTTLIHIHKLFDSLSTQMHFGKIEYNQLVNKSEIEIRELFMEQYNQIPNNMFFFEHLTDINTLNIPSEIKINIFIDDLHQQGKIKKSRLEGIKKVSRIFSTYAYCFHKFYPKTIPVYFLPHSITYTFTENIKFNNNPKHKILLSGRLGKQGKEIYPFRYYVYQLSKKNDFIEQLPVNHNYSIQVDSDDLIHGEKYIKVLNQYLACFTCDASADRPYIVAKHFEIMSSGSLLLAGNPNTKYYFEKLGFQDGVHYLSVTMDDLNEKIAYIQNPNNREIIDTIRRNGYQLVRSKHTHINRANYVTQVLEENDQSIIYRDGINDSEYFMEK